MGVEEKYDIVIVGAGPVGLLLAVCLARWGYKIKIVDNREVPTLTGRADGIQPRSLHLLRNMDLKRQIMAHKPAKVYEVAFWDPQAGGKGIHRTGINASCPKFIDARYPFTTLLHQGLIERVFIDDLHRNGADVQRPWTITGFNSDEDERTYPVEVQLKHMQTEEKENVRTKYLFSGEGARSFIRDQLGIGIRHKDPISHVWGVMDGVVRTDFPDVKIASSTDQDFNPRKQATPEEVQASAKKILRPYYIEWDRVEWYSVYPIGQGIAEKYTIDHRVFLERKLIAEDLLNFDAKYAALFSQRAPSSREVGAASEDKKGSDANEFVEVFKSSAEFTSGYGIAYGSNEFNWSPEHSAQSRLFNPEGNKLRTGRVMPTANVTRVVDANEVQLEQEIPLNGSFRIFIFAGIPSISQKAISDFATNLQKKRSFYSSFERKDIDHVSYHERHNPHSRFFSICTTFAAPRVALSITKLLPPVLARYSDHVYADDIWDGSVPEARFSAHSKMGLDAEKGGIVAVRPDGHVGCVVHLVEGSGTVDALNDYFGSFTTKSIGKSAVQAQL
ncbi:phenol 2-monooxygenase (NADPH), partial [Lecanoromycetidae sp. Uapishka_2]